MPIQKYLLSSPALLMECCQTCHTQRLLYWRWWVSTFSFPLHLLANLLPTLEHVIRLPVYSISPRPHSSLGPWLPDTPTQHLREPIPTALRGRTPWSEP